MGRFVAAFGVVDHFADEHPPVFVEGDRDRIAGLRLLDGELDAETAFHLPGCDRVLGLDGRIARQVLGRIDVRGALGDAIDLLVGVEVLDVFSGLGRKAETNQQRERGGLEHRR